MGAASSSEYYSEKSLEHCEGIKVWDIRKPSVEFIRSIKPEGISKNLANSQMALQADSFHLQGPGTVSCMAWAHGSQLLSAGYTDGTIVHASTAIEANQLPRPGKQPYISDVPRKYRRYATPGDSVPYGMMYSQANLLHLAL